jgi:acyl-CoA thioester hydrolase
VNNRTPEGIAVNAFHWPVRVYWEDTDAGGVVYHAQYVAFLERARSEWLRHLGWSQVHLRDQHGVQFVVASLSVDFHKPARYDDQLLINASLESIRGASLTFKQEVWRDAERLLSARVVVACVDATSFRPKRLPAGLNFA